MVCETEGGRETRMDLDRLPYWPITRCVIKTYLALLSVSWLGLLNWRPLRATAPHPPGALLTAIGFDSVLHCLQLQLEAIQLEEVSLPLRGALTDCTGLFSGPLVTNCNWLNCHRHLLILFHNSHLLLFRSRDILPFIYTGASLIDGSVKGQYVTWGG